jgi:hypothetical protein
MIYRITSRRVKPFAGVGVNCESTDVFSLK